MGHSVSTLQTFQLILLVTASSGFPRWLVPIHLVFLLSSNTLRGVDHILTFKTKPVDLRAFCFLASSCVHGRWSSSSCPGLIFHQHTSPLSSPIPGHVHTPTQNMNLRVSQQNDPCIRWQVFQIALLGNPPNFTYYIFLSELQSSISSHEWAQALPLSLFYVLSSMGCIIGQRPRGHPRWCLSLHSTAWTISKIHLLLSVLLNATIQMPISFSLDHNILSSIPIIPDWSGSHVVLLSFKNSNLFRVPSWLITSVMTHCLKN